MNLKDISWKTFIPPFKSNNKPSTQMKQFEHISKALGREITSKNIGAVTPEEWEKVDASITTPKPEEKTDAPSATAPTAGLTAEAVQAIITTSLNAALTPITARLQSLEDSPAADAVEEPKVIGGEKAKLQPWNDPDNPINKKIDADMGK